MKQLEILRLAWSGVYYLKLRDELQNAPEAKLQKYKRQIVELNTLIAREEAEEEQAELDRLRKLESEQKDLW